MFYISLIINFIFKIIIFFLIYRSIHEIIRHNVLYTGKDFFGISFYEILSLAISVTIINFIIVKII